MNHFVICKHLEEYLTLTTLKLSQILATGFYITGLQSLKSNPTRHHNNLEKLHGDQLILIFRQTVDPVATNRNFKC